jgi:hypothetical protein
MSKKIMLLALTVVTAALFALPTIVTAAENHFEGAGAQGISGSGSGGSLTASGEPTITFSKVTVSGIFTSETTASINLWLEGASTTILGIGLNCYSPGSVSGIIKMSTVFHLVDIGIATNKAGLLVTPPFRTIICGSGFSERKLQLGGNGVIGTVTSPACGAASASLSVSFSAPEINQEHKGYTGSTYDLTSTTEGGSPVTAGLNTSATLKFGDGVSRKLVCT